MTESVCSEFYQIQFVTPNFSQESKCWDPIFQFDYDAMCKTLHAILLQRATKHSDDTKQPLVHTHKKLKGSQMEFQAT